MRFTVNFLNKDFLDSNTHIDTLDEFGDYTDLKKLKIKKIWEELTSSKKAFENKKDELESFKSQKEQIEFDLKEIEDLNPVENEFNELKNKRSLLKNSAKISEGLKNVVDNFYSETPQGIEKLMLSNISILSKIKDLLDDNTIKKIEDLNSSFIDIQEIANYFSSLMNEEFDVSSLEKIEERIEYYKRTSRKHNIDENDLLDFKKKLSKVADSTYELQKNR